MIQLAVHVCVIFWISHIGRVGPKEVLDSLVFTDQLFVVMSSKYRRRTIERLKEHKNIERIKTLKTAELKRLQDDNFRIQWKSKLKETVAESVQKQIDKQIIHDAIKHHAELLEFSDDKLDDSWSELLSGLKLTSDIDDIVNGLTVSRIDGDAVNHAGSPTMVNMNAADTFLKKTMLPEELASHSLSYGQGRQVSAKNRDSNRSFSQQYGLLARFITGNVGNGSSEHDDTKLIRSMFLVGPDSSDIASTLNSHGIQHSNGVPASSHDISNPTGTISKPDARRSISLHTTTKSNVEAKLLYSTIIDEGIDTQIQVLFPIWSRYSGEG